jgi:hypothetical protein
MREESAPQHVLAVTTGGIGQGGVRGKWPQPATGSPQVRQFEAPLLKRAHGIHDAVKRCLGDNARSVVVMLLPSSSPRRLAPPLPEHREGENPDHEDDDEGDGKHHGLTRALNAPAASHKVPDERNYGDRQQRVNQSAGYVKDHPAEDPANQEDKKEREKH